MPSKSLLDLITLTRLHIQEQIQEEREFFPPKSSPSKKLLAAPKAPPMETPIEKKIELPPPVLSLPEKVEKKSEKQIEIPLAFEEMKSLLQKHLPSHYVAEIPSFIYLVSCTAEEPSVHFFKKLASAITSSMVPAQWKLVREKKEFFSLLKNPRCKLILGSYEDLKKYLPAPLVEKRHTLVQIEEKAFFFLENPASYLKDLKLKHALWNSLKLLPLSELLK